VKEEYWKEKILIFSGQTFKASDHIKDYKEKNMFTLRKIAFLSESEEMVRIIKAGNSRMATV
jgi:hypothetical protein